MNLAFDLFESHILRLSAFASGLFFAWTDDPTYLAIALLYLLRNVWIIYEGMCEPEDEKLEKILRVQKLLQINIVPDRTSDSVEENGFKLGIFLARVTPLLPPIVYAWLGIAYARPSTESLALITLIVFMTARTIEVVLKNRIVNMIENKK